MRQIFRATVAIAVTIAFAIPAIGAPIPTDLSTWTEYNHASSGAIGADPGNWVPNADGTVVTQTVNGAPTFFYSTEDADGYRMTAELGTLAFDDDFFGLAVGFLPPDGGTYHDYLLIDWRQGYQEIDWLDGVGPVDGLPGLAVSRVSGNPTYNELWGHVDSPANPDGGLTELARGATLGDTGWEDNTTYAFVVEYTPTSLDVWVDGSHEISITGDFPKGKLAFYDFSQQDLSVSGITFEQLNRPPTVDLDATDEVDRNEGTTYATGGSFTDPDGDALTLSCSGDCTGFTDDGGGDWTWQQDLVEGPGGFSTTVTATDPDGAFATDSFNVTVHNVAPVITATSSLPSNHPLDTSLAVSADFTDAGLEDTHTATWHWGDGTSSTALVSEIPGSGTASGSHTYAGPGTYTISVTVTDDDGDSDTAVLGTVFVFDPNDFVTGGGWVTSPEGAWTAQPDHSGKATFGFVARYQRDGSVHGNLQFQLQKGINLHATGMTSLRIHNGIATFEGSGRVNGVNGYTFKVVATDERYAASTKDLFWITIWDGAAVIYDGSAYPAGGLPIKGKGIQIHDK